MENDIASLSEGLKLTEEEQQEVAVSDADIMFSIAKSKRCVVVCVVAKK